MTTDKNLRLVSDFNIQPLARLLTNSHPSGEIAFSAAPYGQVHQSLAKFRDENLWGLIVWTLPERVIPAYAAAFRQEEVDHQAVLDAVDDYARQLLDAIQDRYAFVATWIAPQDYAGYGPLDWRPNLGIRNLLARMNLRLAEALNSKANVYLLDAQRWLAGASDASAKMWFAAKVPYATKALERAASDISTAINAVLGQSRRIIILDLDNTLWGGVVGETGWQGVRLGGHDHVGEAFKEFQKELKSLGNRGVQLAIASKNDEATALEAIDCHEEMVLRRENFAGWRINWQDKASNILDLLQEIGLGPASAVFIDDNHAERDRVRNAIPDLLVPEWPEDPTQYVTALRTLNCFASASISKEDRQRQSMYAAERSRRASHKESESEDVWLRRLATRMSVSKLDNSNLARAAQLFNKTNQLNLSTRRLSEAELLDWSRQDGCRIFCVSASDQFGDMGLVGILGLEFDGREGRVTDFILSCRVMGRNIEETMIHVASQELKQQGAPRMWMEYLPTKRNRPTLEVLQKVGLSERSPFKFCVELDHVYPRPDTIELQFDQPRA